MGALEIIVLLAGGIIFILSFLIPQPREEVSEATKSLAKEEIKTMVSQEMESIKGHVEDVVDEAVGYAVEKTERSLERLTNEKIMAVNEYSDTVLKEIHKNHEEVMFLYDMLNSKHASVKNTVSEINKTVKEAAGTTREVEENGKGFQKLAPKELALQEENKGLETDNSKSTIAEQEPDHKRKSRKQTVGEPESGISTSNSNEQILELYRMGKTQVAIAKELGVGVGEVQLVVDLYKNV